MTERFKRAYDALVKSYFNNTLAKGSCAACAVGNILADAVGMRTLQPEEVEKRFPYSNSVAEWYDYKIPEWPLRLYTHKVSQKIRELTGYTGREISKIEEAFEENTHIHWMDYPTKSPSEILTDQFNGLKAVVELMMEFDNIKGDQYVDKFKGKLQSA